MMRNSDGIEEPEQMNRNHCEDCGIRSAYIAIGVNSLLTVLKFIVGFYSGSKALFADGLHSAANIVTASTIVLSHRIGKKPATYRYPYGYGKVEFIAAGGISLFITIGAIVLISVSIRHMFQGSSTTPDFSALLMAVISIGANEMLFRYMRCAGTQLKSPTIIASAWGNRADCFSSLVVIIGTIGSRLGFHHLDPVAALCVVAIIIKVSYGILAESVKALMDTSVNDVYGETVKAIVDDMEDIEGILKLKTRQVGQKIWVDLDILVDPEATVGKGHMIATRVKEALLEEIRDVERVWVNFRSVESEG